MKPNVHMMVVWNQWHILWAPVLAETVLKTTYKQIHLLHFYLCVHDIKSVTLISPFGY